MTQYVIAHSTGFATIHLVGGNFAPTGKIRAAVIVKIVVHDLPQLSGIARRFASKNILTGTTAIPGGPFSQ